MCRMSLVWKKIIEQNGSFWMKLLKVLYRNRKRKLDTLEIYFGSTLYISEAFSQIEFFFKTLGSHLKNHDSRKINYQTFDSYFRFILNLKLRFSSSSSSKLSKTNSPFIIQFLIIRKRRKNPSIKSRSFFLNN